MTTEAVHSWLPAEWRRRVVELAAPVRSPRSLAVLRVGLSVLLLVQALLLLPWLVELYGSKGLLQSPLAKLMQSALVPSVSWLVEPAARLGIGERVVLAALFAVHVVALVTLALGWRTRGAAVVVWLTYVAFFTGPSAYGANEFMKIALFYGLFAPIGEAWSLDARGREVKASRAAGASYRVLQVHLCVVYLSSGLEKASGAQWWNGEAIWRATVRPELGGTAMAWLAQIPTIVTAVCVGTVILEIAYPLFTALRRTRRVWLVGIVSLHLGIALCMGLWLFAATMILLNLVAWECVPGLSKEQEQ